MKLEGLWNQFTKRQFDYLGNIIYRSNAKSICAIGSFAGSVARAIWKAIKVSDKELYLLDNYAFLPEALREPFFKAVKKTVGDSDRIHTVLESSHVYDWTQHDFVILNKADVVEIFCTTYSINSLNAIFSYKISKISPDCRER